MARRITALFLSLALLSALAYGLLAFHITRTFG